MSRVWCTTRYLWHLVLLALAAYFAVVDASLLEVDLGYVTYRGSVNPKTGNVEFLGMRYAQSPTGPLRWREPRQPKPIPSILPADAMAPLCPRGAMGVQPVNTFRTEGTVPLEIGTEFGKRQQQPPPPPLVYSEDCLFLNVFVPPGSVGNRTSDPRLPVVVWIHGGGYIGGGIGNDGNDLISAAKGGVVVVQMQYRLGVFGFLAGKQVKKNGVLNAGLLDQQYALQWVQKHIHKFGGDPRKVTIWGQSAGAGSVVQHLVANGGKTNPPLFRGAITSSTFLPSQYAFDGRIPEAIYNQTITRAGCLSSSNTLDCLRSLTTEELVAINVEVCSSGFYGTFVFAPVVDGSLIAKNRSEAIRRGEINTRNLLAVTNTYEGVGFVDSSAPSTIDVPSYISNLFPLLPQRQVEKTAVLYGTLGTGLDQIGAIMGEAIFACPTYTLLRGFNGRAYKAHFAVPPARHAGDVAYYYPSNGLPAWPEPEFSKAFSQSFLDFVQSQDPNAKVEPTILPLWVPWTSKDDDGKTEMVFNRTGDSPDLRTTKTEPGLWERCLFWEGVSRWIGQ